MLTGITNTSTLVIAFPDVCKSPLPPGGLVPIPYPNTATIATAKQAKTQVATKEVVVTRSSIRRSTGDEGGVLSGALYQAKKASEAQMLRSSLGALTLQLQQLTTNDPAVWANVVSQFAVTASALYLTLAD